MFLPLLTYGNMSRMDSFEVLLLAEVFDVAGLVLAQIGLLGCRVVARHCLREHSKSHCRGARDFVAGCGDASWKVDPLLSRKLASKDVATCFCPSIQT